MILSGPKACRGSINEVRILPHFLHSAVDNPQLANIVRAEGPQAVEGRAPTAAPEESQRNVQAIEEGSGLFIPIVRTMRRAVAGSPYILRKDTGNFVAGRTKTANVG
jgi:hypothetical protein